jgi:MioC protein
MAVQISILIGTMTGTAELVAQDLEPIFQDAGFEVETIDMDGLDAEVFQRPGFILICTSTYGQGEVPDNAVAFYEGLQAGKPNLSEVKFGVIGLGDSTYSDTYNAGGQRFEALLLELGAKMIGERMVHNASSDDLPEDMAIDWVEEWIPKLQSA